MKDKNGNGLMYTGDENNVSWYNMWLNGNIVFRVTIDNTDPMRNIIARSVYHAHETTYDLKTSAIMALHGKKIGPKPEDVEVVEHIDSLELQKEIYSRLPFILAKLYVPQFK